MGFCDRDFAMVKATSYDNVNTNIKTIRSYAASSTLILMKYYNMDKFGKRTKCILRNKCAKLDLTLLFK